MDLVPECIHLGFRVSEPQVFGVSVTEGGCLCLCLGRSQRWFEWIMADILRLFVGRAVGQQLLTKS